MSLGQQIVCDHNLLKELLPLQVKIEKLHCTLNSNCWCNQLSYRFPLTQSFEQCMSPQEILNEAGNNLSSSDIKYLTFLTHKEFVPP